MKPSPSAASGASSQGNMRVAVFGQEVATNWISMSTVPICPELGS